MTMGFQAGDVHQLHGLKAGDAVRFDFDPAPAEDGSYLISRIERAEPPR